MVNGTIRWIRARPRANKTRARRSEHGIRGLFLRSNTNTAIQPSLTQTALTGASDASVSTHLPSGMSATGSTLIVGRMAYEGAEETFGSLPLPSIGHAAYNVISSFQCPGLRKHPGVGRNDLLQT